MGIGKVRSFTQYNLGLKWAMKQRCQILKPCLAADLAWADNLIHFFFLYHFLWILSFSLQDHCWICGLYLIVYRRTTCDLHQNVYLDRFFFHSFMTSFWVRLFCFESFFYFKASLGSVKPSLVTQVFIYYAMLCSFPPIKIRRFHFLLNRPRFFWNTFLPKG